jgi:hypothetical protein
MKKFLLIIFVLPFFSSNCTDKPIDKLAECSESNTVKFPKDALARFYFKDSSFWVYKDSVTGDRDSVWVVKSTDAPRNTFRDINLKNRCYQFLSVELNNTNGELNRISIRPHSVNDNINNSFANEHFTIDFNYSQLNFQPIYRFFMRGINYDMINEEDGKLSFVNGYDFKGTTIDSVILVENPISNFDIYSKAWYAKYLGMIKYKLKNGRVWELTNYKIKQ